jgi:hypothetical protein
MGRLAYQRSQKMTTNKEEGGYRCQIHGVDNCGFLRQQTAISAREP